MNTCFFHLFHDRFSQLVRDEYIGNFRRDHNDHHVVWLVILFIGTDATDSDKKNKEYYASHNDS